MTLLQTTLAARARPHFPALGRRLAGWPVAYFDGPGGTQVPQAVVDAVSHYLLHTNANDGWAFCTSVETDAVLRQAHAAAAAFVNAASPDEIVFGNNMTTLTFHLARAVGRMLQAGDEIVVTDLDHHANIDPWVALARDAGAVIRHVPLRGNRPELDVAAYEALLSKRTKLVAVGLSSNAFGTINPVAALAAAAHRVGALVFVDAVHSAAHALPDVVALGADLLAFSAYKVYGPHVGVAYCRDAVLDRLDVPRLAPQRASGSRRAESGTLNHEGIAGTGAALAFLSELDPDATGSLRDRLGRAFTGLERAESAVFATLVDGLRALPHVRLHEPSPELPRHPTIAFSVARWNARDVAQRLSDDHAIFVSHGDFYASTAVPQVVPDADGGVVRAGVALYSTVEEAQRLVDAVATFTYPSRR